MWLQRQINDTIERLGARTSPHNGQSHHYVCFGKVHVKTATLFIVCFKCVWALVMGVYVLLQNSQQEDHWLDLFYETVQMFTLLGLVMGYKRQEAMWMWPFMAIEFTWLVLYLIMYVVSVMQVLLPSQMHEWTPAALDDKTSTATVRLVALAYAIRFAAFSVLRTLELHVLLACNCYFDDVKTRTQAVRQRPIILTDEEVPEAVVVAPANGTNDLQSFPNPNFNFSLQHSDEEEQEEDALGWPHNAHASPRDVTSPKPPTLE